MSDTAWGVWDYPEPPAEKPRPICPRCKGEMGDKVYFVEFEFRCEDCFDDYKDGLTREQIANAMEVEIISGLFKVNGELLHDYQFDDYVNGLNRDELANAMDIEVLTLEEFEDEHI